MSGTVIRWCTCPLVVSAVAGLSTQRALIDPGAAKIRVRHAQFTASAGPDAFLCIRSSQDRGRTWSGIRVCPAWSWDCSGWEERDGTGPEWRRGWTGIFRPNCKFWNQIGGANPALRAALVTSLSAGRCHCLAVVRQVLSHKGRTEPAVESTPASRRVDAPLYPAL